MEPARGKGGASVRDLTVRDLSPVDDASAVDGESVDREDERPASRRDGVASSGS